MEQSATTFEGFFLPLMKELVEIPPGQTPGNITQEFHYMAHQLAEKLRKLHAAFFPRPQDVTPQPQHMSHHPQNVISQHQQLSPIDLPEEELDCTCKDCLRFTAFTEDPTAKKVDFAFGTESRIAHYKTHYLPRINKGGFKYTCTVTPMENNIVEKYTVTVRKTKAQFAMGTQKGDVSQDKTECRRPQCQRLRPRPQRRRARPRRRRPQLRRERKGSASSRISTMSENTKACS